MNTETNTDGNTEDLKEFILQMVILYLYLKMQDSKDKRTERNT